MSETATLLGDAPAAPPADTAAPPPAAGGDDRAWLPEAYRADPAFASFKTPEALAKSYKDNAAFVGADKATLLKLPKDEAAPEWSEVWGKLGRPEKPEGYEIQMPEGFPSETLDAFKQYAHQHNLPQKQAQAMAAFYAERETQARAQLAQTATTELKQEWGAAFDDQLHSAKRALREVGGEDVVKVLESTGLGNHPAMIRMFAKLGAERAEPGALKGQGMPSAAALPPAAAQQAIAEKQGDPEFRKKYLNGEPAAVAEMRRLFDMAYPSQT